MSVAYQNHVIFLVDIFRVPGNKMKPYLIIVTGATGAARVNFFCPV